LFDSQFAVSAIDPDGKKFERVSRIVARSSSLEMDLSLDVATDIYPIQPGQNLTVQIVSSLGGPNADADKDAWRMDGGGGLADEFDYVMHGKIYKYDDSPSETVTVYASFGGLLMALTGSYRHLSSLSVGSNVFLLVR
ncbi:RNA polymerase, partial [Acaromyces ingoldii]